MPTAYIKKLAEQGHGTVAELEHKWDAAKAAAKKAGKEGNMAYTTSIFQNMAKIKSSHIDTELSPGHPVSVGASARLRQVRAYAPQPNTSFGQPSELHGGDNAYLDSLVNSGKFTREEVDDAWAKAKETANKNAKENPNIVPSYAYTTAIFQSILGIKQKAAVQIRAFARLMAAAPQDVSKLKLVRWFDKSTKNWVVTLQDKAGEEVGEPIVVGTREAAMKIKKDNPSFFTGHTDQENEDRYFKDPKYNRTR
jgi:hypothetical protein